jgi:hypothetical protein
VTTLPLPRIPWQLTGNHWLALPCIHPADGSLHAVGVLHRGARSAVEFAGASDFATGTGAPLARLSFEIDGVTTTLAAASLAWERALGWLPTFTGRLDGLIVRGTVFAPYGRDADTAGAVYAVSLENRGETDVSIGLSLEGTLGHRQLRVRTASVFDDAHRAVVVDGETVVLKGAALPGLVALAIGADAPVELAATDAARPSYVITRRMMVPAGGRAEAAFYIAAGPEQDGAHATVAVMRRRGWRDLLAATRDALRELEQSSGNETMDRLINNNLLLAYFFSVGRALDDAHFYIVRTRAPWHGRGVTVREWEALTWTIPAVQLADPPLARELLLRVCEVHGYSPGKGVRYLDGTLFEPGFSLEGAAGYAIAVDRYIRETGDDQIVEEPTLADTLYLASEDLAARRDERYPLYSTEVTPSGAPAPMPYTLHGNAVVAQALEVFRRTLDEATAREIEDPDAVRAALKRHFSRDDRGKSAFVAAIDLTGKSIADDDPMASALWLPFYEMVERSDSAYRRTVRGVGAEPRFLVQQCARLLGPDASSVAEWLRRAPLDNGFAAEELDADGRAMSNGADASLAGLLAYTLWYAVHALGVTP